MIDIFSMYGKFPEFFRKNSRKFPAFYFSGKLTTLMVLCCRTILLQLAGFLLLICGMMIYNNLVFRPFLIRHNCLKADPQPRDWALINHPDGKIRYASSK